MSHRKRIYPYLCSILGALLISIGTAHAGGKGSPLPPNAEMTDRLIVKYRTARTGAALAARERSVASVITGRGLRVERFRRGAQGEDIFRLERMRSNEEVEQLAKEIALKDPEVEYAQADRRVFAQLVPNDTRYPEQWHYFEPVGGVNLPGAWDLSTGSGVITAVIDTGYRPHADLIANIVGGYDFISDVYNANDGDGQDSDASDPGDGCGIQSSSWHGTHVAGTIAAQTNNGAGVAGVAFNARVVPIRVLGCEGGYESDIADGIIWASGGTVAGIPANPNPARILNLSLSGSGACSPMFQNAINSARSRNSVVVVAAGNWATDAGNFQPANCTGVITVAATNRTGGEAWYTNFGSTVEIAAPGGDTEVIRTDGVLSTLNAGVSGPGADIYEFYQGTSMATPHVVGIVALMLSRNPSLTPDQVLTILQQTARPFPATCSGCGAGIADAYAAVMTSGGGLTAGQLAAIQAVIDLLIIQDE